MKINLKFNGLLGSGSALVIGLPRSFNLKRELLSARHIKLATAFAHPSGWNIPKSSVKRTKASVKLLTGLSFCQTDPHVQQWWKLSQRERVRARLFTNKSVTFHPKVLLVETDSKRFAVVGSGNLSAGGFSDNVECSLYSSESRIFEQADAWFEGLFADDILTKDLLEPDIRRYKSRFDQAREARRTIQALELDAKKEIGERDRFGLRKWNHAVGLAKQFFASGRFQKSYRDDLDSVTEEIKSALNYPTFTFGQDGLDRFYKIRTLGHLIEIGKPGVWRQRKKLRQGLKLLIDDSRPIERRLHAVLDSDGRYRVNGVSLNFVSKVLAAHDSSKYTVYNRPIAKALDEFNYEAPRGLTSAQKYHAYATEMKLFLDASGGLNTLYLDAFFYDYWASHIRPKGPRAI